ncbi:MAG: hypothetical protein WAZ96_00550 [Candidatus Moraniibacteriota bacterium]
MKKLFQMQWTQKELRTGKRIMASIMLPILIFQMTSMNFLAMEMMTARADDVVVTADAPKEELKKEEAPKEEPKKEEAPKEEVKKEEAPKVETPKVEEKTVPEVKEATLEVAPEVKTETPKEEDVTPVAETPLVEVTPAAEGGGI